VKPEIQKRWASHGFSFEDIGTLIREGKIV
jgi:hypothetical protein